MAKIDFVKTGLIIRMAVVETAGKTGESSERAGDWFV